MFRFLHAADLHLDSPLRGLERYENAPLDEIRAAPRRALENLVRLAVEEEVSFLVLAGDLYDGDWKDFNTGIFFVRQMRRLEEAGIGVHLIAGNHDAASQITKQLTLPSNVVLYSHAKPQTVELPELGVAIHGQSFKSQNVTRDLASKYPRGSSDRFDIGILHTSLNGRPGHDHYAPTSVDVLKSKAYDYWALGHVHQREIVCQDPWIVFPGNLQGRHVREVGAKGATLVSVDGGEVVSVDHQPLDVVRWMRVDVDVAEARRAEEVPALVRAAVGAEIERLEPASISTSPPLLALRLTLTGRSEAHSQLTREAERWIHELRECISNLGSDGAFLERVVMHTQRVIDFDAALSREDAMGELMRLIVSLEEDSIELEEFVDPMRDVWTKVMSARVGLAPDDSIDDFDPTRLECLRSLLPSVRDELLSRLFDARLFDAGEPR